MQSERKPTAMPRSQAMTWLALVLLLAVFVLDVFLLDGQGEAVLYAVVVLIFLWSIHWRYVFVVAAVCTLLSLVGFDLASGKLSPDGSVVNHIISFMVLWLTTILGFRMNQLSDLLAASEAQTHAIVESAAEGIITINEEGIVESYNTAAVQMFGYDAAEVIGQNVTMLMPANYREAHERGLRRYLSTGEKHIIGSTREVEGLRQDGTAFPLLISVSEMRLQQYRSFVGILLDITDLQLAQGRAVQVERLAAIGEAMAGLAHESRNALQRSQAALEMLARTVGDQDDATNLIGRIQEAQDDLHQLYEEVRRYAAPVTVETNACRVDSLVQEAWEKVSINRAGRDAQLHQIDASFDLTCDLDEFAIRRVFRNILDNSLDAIEGPVRITASFSEVMYEGRPAIEVSLRDNGPGIDEATRRKLFEPFFTTKTSGTGLGMAIARRYVEAHGGVIDVATNSSQGADFRITLPRSQA